MGDPLIRYAVVRQALRELDHRPCTSNVPVLSVILLSNWTHSSPISPFQPMLGKKSVTVSAYSWVSVENRPSNRVGLRSSRAGGPG